jgi:large subunit ribosomal protein L25
VTSTTHERDFTIATVVAPSGLRSEEAGTATAAEPEATAEAPKKE